MTEGPKINDAHRAFSRALVALAREHQMDNVMMTFRQAYTLGTPEVERCYEQVKLSWSTGRHGVTSRIRLETSQIDEFSEELSL